METTGFLRIMLATQEVVHLENLLEKIDSYQILANFLPGAFFIMGLKLLLGIDFFVDWNVGESILALYFVGLLINRLGSLLIEPLMKKIRIVKYAPYDEFVKAVQLDSKIDTLSETNNHIRSILTATLLLPITYLLYILYGKWYWFTLHWKIPFWTVLVVVFLLSYRKQAAYVKNRVKTVNKENSEINSKT